MATNRESVLASHPKMLTSVLSPCTWQTAQESIIYSLAFSVIDGPHPKALVHDLALKSDIIAC